MFNPYYNPFSYVIEKRTGQFVVAMMVCMLISYIPILKIPYDCYSHFFHEMAQGLVALILDGEFTSITFDLRGNVVSNFTSYPLWMPIFAGYIGNIIGGILVYYAAEPWPAHISNALTGLVVLMIAFVGFFFADTGSTIVIAVLFSLIFSLLMPLRIWVGVRVIFKCAGIYMMMMVFRIPVDSLLYHVNVDAAQLSNVTPVPVAIWIIIWVMLGITSLKFLWVSHCVKGW